MSSPFQTPSPSRLGAKAFTASARAFSLVETTMAIGIVAFALVGMLGLLPAGLTTFRKAMDTSTSSHIVQQMVTDLQQGDFGALSQPQAIRYFDDQGNSMTSPAEADGTQALYYVNTVAQTPSSLPGGPSSSLATVTVEIVKNPSHQTLQRDPVTQGVLDQPNLSVSRFPVFISSQND